MVSPRSRHAGARERERRAEDRRSDALLTELYELEEEAYRLSLRHAERLGQRPSGVALRALVAHINEALEEIRALARIRRVRVGSLRALAIDTLRRAADALSADGEADQRALLTLRRGISLVRRLRAAAVADGDEVLAHWCEAFVRARHRLVDEAAPELEAFGRSVRFLRQTRFAIASG
jgi:hypothetical protein